MSTSDLVCLGHLFVFSAVGVVGLVRFGCLREIVLLFYRHRRLNLVFFHRSVIAARHVCFNAVEVKELPGLCRREPGCDMQEQPLVWVSTR